MLQEEQRQELKTSAGPVKQTFSYQLEMSKIKQDNNPCTALQQTHSSCRWTHTSLNQSPAAHLIIIWLLKPPPVWNGQKMMSFISAWHLSTGEEHSCVSVTALSAPLCCPVSWKNSSVSKHLSEHDVLLLPWQELSVGDKQPSEPPQSIRN